MQLQQLQQLRFGAPAHAAERTAAPSPIEAKRREVVARGAFALDVEFAVLILDEPVGTGDDHGADRVGEGQGVAEVLEQVLALQLHVAVTHFDVPVGNFAD